MTKQWTVAFDFDGVIQKYHDGDDDRLNRPIFGIRILIQDLVDEGAKVVIFSDRDPFQIKCWLEQHEFPDLDVTDRKLPEFDVIVDGRAIGFDPVYTIDGLERKDFKRRLLNFKPHWRDDHVKCTHGGLTVGESRS